MTLTAADLARMRAAAGLFLPETATVLTHGQASDGGGGRSSTYTPSVTVPARLAHAGGGETGTQGDRISDETTHIITLPAGTQVTESDRIRIGTTDYDITAIRQASYEVTRRVEVKEA